MPEYDTTIYDSDDNPIPVTVHYEIEPEEPGFYSFIDGWVEPPLGPNVIFNSVLDSNGHDRRNDMDRRDFERIEHAILSRRLG